MNSFQQAAAKRIAEATEAIFGNSAIAQQVRHVCQQYDRDVDNIQAGRGIQALLVAIVGAKGQGKTWTARQLVHSEAIRAQMRSGDLQDDATSKLVWIGPVPPDRLDTTVEVYHSCPTTDMIDVGQPLVLLDTPGVTDANPQAARIAKESLSLAPVKLLIIARDQLRAAANLTLAKQIDGSICIPIITSVEPDEFNDEHLARDLQSLRQQLNSIARNSRIISEIKVPDFEITGDEVASGRVLRSELLQRLNELKASDGIKECSLEGRLQAATNRLRAEVRQIISRELPQLDEAVTQLKNETQQLPSRVIDSLLGSQHVLETGIRMRLRTRLVNDTSVMLFPYRTVLSILNLTHGAWDRVVLALAGSVPSIFGALSSWAKNVRQSRDFAAEVQDGIRQRTQQQVEERLHPLCDQFHRTILKLRPREERPEALAASQYRVRLLGIDQLQTESQRIFEDSIERSAVARGLAQLLGLVGVLLFWLLMSSPIITLYRDYFHTSWAVWASDDKVHVDQFPHPSSGLIFTSLLLSALPLLIYCMFVLTLTLNRRRIERIARNVILEHEQAIRQLQDAQVIRLQFGDELVQQAEYLLNLK